MRRAPLRGLLPFFAVFLLWPLWSGSARGAAPAIITGRVTFDDGKPAAGQTAVVRSTDYVSPTPSGTAVTDADGRYTVSVDTDLFPALFANAPSPTPPSDSHFSVTVRIGGHLYLEPASRAVTLTPGLTSAGTDFLVTAGPKVTVRVHDALTGLPVPDVQIQDNRYGSGNGNPTLGVTDARGIALFHLTSLSANLVLFLPGGKTPSVQIAPGYLGYKQLWLKEAQDVVWDVKTYSDPLPKTANWQGTVLGPDGRPAAGATVHILRQPEATTQTDSRGRFSVSLPLLGKDEADSMGHLTVAVLAERGRQTALLAPTPEAVWGGMTLRLTDTPLSSVTGVVVDSVGHPEAGVPVFCNDFPLLSEAVLTRQAGNGGVTDAAGRFTIAGLPTGHLRLSLGGGGFGDTTIRPGDLSSWDVQGHLLLASGQQDDLGRITVPAADRTLTGRLVTDTGRPISDPGRPNPDHNIWLTITGAHTQPTVDLDKDGQSHASRLVAEPLTMTITAWFPDGVNRWTTKEVARVSVQAGQKDVRIVVPAADLPPNAVVTALPAVLDNGHP